MATIDGNLTIPMRCHVCSTQWWRVWDRRHPHRHAMPAQVVCPRCGGIDLTVDEGGLETW